MRTAEKEYDKLVNENVTGFVQDGGSSPPKSTKIALITQSVEYHPLKTNPQND